MYRECTKGGPLRPGDIRQHVEAMLEVHMKPQKNRFKKGAAGHSKTYVSEQFSTSSRISKNHDLSGHSASAYQ